MKTVVCGWVIDHQAARGDFPALVRIEQIGTSKSTYFTLEEADRFVHGLAAATQQLRKGAP